MKSFVVALLLAAVALPVQSQGLPADGSGTYRDFVPHNRAARTPHGVQAIAGPPALIREGARALMFDVRAGDCGGADCREDRERVERWHRAGSRPGEAQWYAWSVRLREDFPDIQPTNVTIGQFKQEPQACEVAALSIQNGRLVFMNKLCDANQNAVYMIDQPIMSLSQARGRWIDLMVHTNWSAGADGFLDLYVNGQRVASHRGRTVYNNRDRVDFRFGIYRSFVSRYETRAGTGVPRQVAVFDNIRRGPTRESVDIRR